MLLAVVIGDKRFLQLKGRTVVSRFVPGRGQVIMQQAKKSTQSSASVEKMAVAIRSMQAPSEQLVGLL